MVKSTRIVGRSALAAVLAVSMVPSAALAQEDAVLNSSEVAAQTDAVEFPNNKSTEYSNKTMPLIAYWGEVVPGAPIRFKIQFNGTEDQAARFTNFKYRVDGVMRFTNGSWENIDYSYQNQYKDESEFEITFQTSGQYRVRLSCYGDFAPGVSTYFGDSSHIDIQIGINDANFPTVEQRIESIVAECNNQGFSSQYDKALWLHDWLVDNCEYDYTMASAGSDSLLAVGTGTCAAYRTVYEILLGKVGIKSQRMTGNGHEWNAVNLDGTWYQVDVTWDDDSGLDVVKSLSDAEKNILRHQYFGMSDEFTALVHPAHVAQSGYECPTMDGHYLVKNGYVANWADSYSAEIAEKIAAGETSFTVYARTDALGSALSMYGKVPHQLMAWDLSNRDWSVVRANEKVSAKVTYQHGKDNQLGSFSVVVTKESTDAGSGSGSDNSGNTGSGSTTGGSGNTGTAGGSGGAGGNSGSTVTPSVKPAPVPEKAKPGLTAYNGSYRYGKPNGTYAKNEWVTLNGKWYYFGADGVAAKWSRKIGNYWYYFNERCQMVTGWVTWKADGAKSYFDGNGRALTGLQKIGGATYYFDPATARSKRWSVKVGNDLYYFGSDYKMVTGWVTWNADKSKSYFGSNGKAFKGLQKIGNATYYFDPATARSKRWSVWVGSDLYYFGGDYKMVTGWVTWNADKSKSYFGSNGKALKGFQKISGATYYFDPSTARSKRWAQNIGGSLYYFDGNGRMRTGWLTWNADKSRSYFGADGKALVGWQKLGGATYYFNPSNARSVKWSQTIAGSQYYFDGNGRMYTGWLQWNADKKWSYFYSNGKMATGTQTIDGRTYTFDANGKTARSPQ